MRQFDDFLCPLMDNLGGNHSIQNHNVTKNDYDFSIVRLHPPRIIVQSKGTEPKRQNTEILFDFRFINSSRFRKSACFRNLKLELLFGKIFTI